MPKPIRVADLKKKKLRLARRFKATPEQRAEVNKRLWAAEAKMREAGGKHGRAMERPFTKMKALRDHLCGDTIEVAAKRYNISLDALSTYKAKFFRKDPALTQFLEELLEEAALDSLQIFQEKKDEMTGPQAAMTTGIFVDKVIALRKARTNDFRPDTAIPIKELQVLQRILEAGASAKRINARVIDINPEELAKLQDGKVVDE